MKKGYCSGFQKFVVSLGKGDGRAAPQRQQLWRRKGGTPVARWVLEEERKEDSRKRKSLKYFPAGQLLGIQRHC